MSSMLQRLVCALACALFSGRLSAQETAPTVVADELRRAVAEMRKLPVRVPDEELEERNRRVDAAWDTLLAAKEAGVAALLEEAAKLDASKEKDDKFKLGAAAVIWEIGKFDHARDVAALWHGSDLALFYNYVFYPALESAFDGDERALPMLTEVLHDQSGTVFFDAHSMTVQWPETHRFLWGPMGRKAVPTLEKVLETEKDPVALSSAITLLADHWDVALLPRLRSIASDTKHGGRFAALRALGAFGHPDDFELLIGALKDAEGQNGIFLLRGLSLYGDLRTAPSVIPLTKSADPELRRNAFTTLCMLPTLDGLDALEAALKIEDEETKQGFGEEMTLFGLSSVTMNECLGQGREARAKSIASARAQAQRRSLPRGSSRVLTREEIETTCKQWIKDGRLDSASFTSHHVLSQATLADVALLVDVRGSLFRRLSDECLYEVGDIDTALSRIVRSQYRVELGPCDRVTPLPAPRDK
ncbi:MAG: HEAT repeat domain-containing protein [Planctomycetota bacterium]|nr:HEAT repeat domain-containing protein [Planctomycetota bacterium]